MAEKGLRWTGMGEDSVPDDKSEREYRVSLFWLTVRNRVQPISAPLKPFSAITHFPLAIMLALNCAFAHSQTLTHLLRASLRRLLLTDGFLPRKHAKEVCQGLRVSENAIKCEHCSKEEVGCGREGLEMDWDG